MKQETVSIIMSTRNRAHYLPRALDSILSQTFRDYSVYILDDASTDATREVLEKYSKKFSHITIIRNESAEGTTKNARRLIDLSNGIYIARLDDDDVWLPEKLEKQVQFMEKNPEVALLGTAIRGIDFDGKLLAPKVNLTGDGEIRKALLRVNQFAQSSILLRREVYERVGGYNPEYLTEDYELWVRIGSRGFSLANLPEILTYIGVTEGQMTEKKRKKLILSELKVLKKYHRFYPGFFRALIAKCGALVLSPRLSRFFGGYLRKYMGF